MDLNFITVEPLFSTPVVIFKIDNFKNNYIDVDNYDKNIFTLNCKQPNVLNHISDNILLEPKYDDLKRIIDNAMSHFVYNILCFPQKCKLKLVNSWITIGLPNSVTHQHYHSNSVYSGILYLKSLPTSGSLKFCINGSNPSFSTTTIRPTPEKINIFNGTEWSISPLTGDIILFPSHLLHSVTENISGENRAALAFNYFLVGDISNTSTSALYL